MATKNYTLEKHLETLSKDDEKVKQLFATWTQNKNHLPDALGTIGTIFPHYSKHDITHSIRLIDNVQRFLGAERINQLGATDTFLILMAALTHDLGMYLSFDMLKKEWEKPEMEDRLKKYTKEADPQIKHASTLLLNYRCRQDDPEKGFAWALELRNAVTLISAQMMRGEHAKRSKEYIENEEGVFAKMANHFYMDDYSMRYKLLLANVAQLHCEGFDEVMNLHAEEDGVGDDTVHPRFIACLIRLGDLLDMDSDRFNDFSLSTIEEIPESSKAHYDKHMSLEHQKISSYGIEFTMNCKTDASYRVACELEKMLKEEVEKQHLHWSSIAPDDLGGNPPEIHQNSLKILFDGKETRPELRNLRFNISGQRTFEMLKGGAIYKNPGRVFIREIVQNALDATKLQIWKDMDYFFPYHLENPERDIKCVDDIKFTSDIPAWVYEKYPIHLNVEYDDKKEVVRVVCEDWGTGISEESLIRMTSQVGASRKADKDYNETIKQMPYFLQPTAAFGLGLQTVFYVTDEFTVLTCCPGKSPSKITFRSSVDGSYCSLEDENIVFERSIEDTDRKKSVTHGTTITIEIGKEHFGELFEISEEQVKELDKDPAGCLCNIPEGIDLYVKDSFRGMEFVPIKYKSPFLSKRLGEDEEMKELEFLSEEEHFRVYMYDDGLACFYIEENKFGSILDIDFSKKYYFNDFCLRGVSIDDGFSYLGDHSMCIRWNLFSRESDQLVTISRDNLLPKGNEWCTNTMNSLMRDVIRLTYRKLHDKCEECSSESENNELIIIDTEVFEPLIIDPEDFEPADSSSESEKKELLQQYFNLCLVNWNLPEPIKVDYQILDNLKLDKKDYSDMWGNVINASDVFNASVILTSRDRRSLYLYNNAYQVIRSAELNYWSFLCRKFIFVRRYEVIPDGFVCSVVYRNEMVKQDLGFYQLEKLNISVPKFVEMRDSWTTDLGWHYSGSYRLYNGFIGYKKIVVGEEAPLLGYEKPFHGNCWIYPFGEIPREDRLLRREKMYNKLKYGYIKKLVPDYIVKLIQKYNVLKNNNLTEDEIYDEYIRMILDFTFGSDKKRKGTK